MSAPPAPVSAVVPARNAERTLADALASIRAQTVAVAEIVVVDDGSSDATAAIARAAGATVVEGPRMGPGAARNAGIRVKSRPSKIRCPEVEL